ncbi:hypothetical protein HNS38_03215 [Lentimicrobium sp. L6]|uniref:hypothetical protein n=1 Tax=Lentimicrobium sp. L6 TaxID=2735916 RepID=UPI0015575FB0|nr:hypothetical protein [Lentimicrobium sp. L6]NPD83752.1 hypothetical protein [Lentimicrobium sp. L6]
MKINQKIILISFIGGISVFLFWKTYNITYHPIIIDIEFQANALIDDHFQLFYSEGRYFDETLSVKEAYSPNGGFVHLTTMLPSGNVTRLRIDPGNKIDTIQIHAINIKSNNQILSFKGTQILSHFDLINLRVLNSSDSSIQLVQNQSRDIQLIYKQKLNENFDLYATQNTSHLQVFILFVTGFLFLMIILFSKQILVLLTKLRQWYQNKYHGLLHICLSNYSITLLAILGIKLILVSAQQMTCYSAFGHDDGLFVKLAYSLSAGNWLGAYNNLTLAKGMVYPAFIALNSFFGISLFLSQHLLFGLSCYLMLRAFYPIIKGNYWRILFFSVLLFNPVSSDWFTTRVLRDYFFLSISIIVVASFIAVYLRRQQNPRSYLGWVLVAGISLFLQQNTREEGFMFLPFLAWMSLLSLLVFLKKQKVVYGSEYKTSKKVFVKGVFIIVLPYLILIGGNLTIATINYFSYGAFIRNEIKTEAFTKAYAALTQVESDKWLIDVPYTTESRMKAYRVSSAFAELEPFMESEENGFLKGYPSGGKEIVGAFSIWSIRYAAEEAGYHDNLPQSQQFYYRMAGELNTAFENGDLQKNTNFSMFSFTWDSRYAQPTMNKIIDIIKHIAFFENYHPKPLANFGNLESISLFQNMTNTPAAHLTGNINNYTPASIVKIFLLKAIQWIYAVFHPLLWLLSILSFLALSVRIIKNGFKDKLVGLWWIGSLLFAIAATRVFLIAFISVSQWDAVNMQYLSISYPFLLTFEILYLYTLVNMLKVTSILRTKKKDDD